MKIYRLENVNNVGMYTCRAARVIGGAIDGPRWPMAHNDVKFMEDHDDKILNHFGGEVAVYGGEKFVSWQNRNCTYKIQNYRFGFKSKVQLKKWVCKKAWRKALAEKNILLNVYEIEPKFVMIGSSQCTFNYKEAKLVQTLCPTDLD